MKQALGVSIRQKSDGTATYTCKWKEGTEERRCKSVEFPRPELESALDSLGTYIPLICMIPAENIRRTYTAGATFEYTKAGITLLTLGVQLELTNGASFEFTSPVVSVDLEHADPIAAQTPAEKISALAKELHDEIIMYAEGKRAQQSLEFEDGEQEEEEEI